MDVSVTRDRGRKKNNMGKRLSLAMRSTEASTICQYITLDGMTKTTTFRSWILARQLKTCSGGMHVLSTTQYLARSKCHSNPVSGQTCRWPVRLLSPKYSSGWTVINVISTHAHFENGNRKPVRKYAAPSPQPRSFPCLACSLFHVRCVEGFASAAFRF